MRLTFDSVADDGNEDIIFKEFVAADTLRFTCETTDCKGCAPFEPTCNPVGVDSEAASCPRPHVQLSRNSNGAPIPCIGATADSFHQASCTVPDAELPAVAVYDV
eukprot:SAG31_NODE_17400_length_672_cov_0.991274_1_plen_104_part_10